MKNWRFREVLIISSLAGLIALMALFGGVPLTLKFSVFALILVIAGYIDVKTRIIPDWIHILIVVVAFIGVDWMNSMLGLFFVPLPYFIMALLKENSIGGGDIKLMGACGFYLGVRAGYAASIVGLFIAVISYAVIRLIAGQKINQSLPLAPFLGAGCIATCFII
jgi:leader peptidase (prepilin peptidase)/N-methyltransferase